MTRLFDRNSCGLEKCEMNCVSLFDEHMSCDSTTCRAKLFFEDVLGIKSCRTTGLVWVLLCMPTNGKLTVNLGKFEGQV